MLSSFHKVLLAFLSELKLHFTASGKTLSIFSPATTAEIHGDCISWIQENINLYYGYIIIELTEMYNNKLQNNKMADHVLITVWYERDCKEYLVQSSISTL